MSTIQFFFQATCSCRLIFVNHPNMGQFGNLYHFKKPTKNQYRSILRLQVNGKAWWFGAVGGLGFVPIGVFPFHKGILGL